MTTTAHTHAVLVLQRLLMPCENNADAITHMYDAVQVACSVVTIAASQRASGHRSD